ITTVAQSLAGPGSVAVDSAGNLYVAEPINQSGVVLKISNGVITMIAGGGASLGDNGPAIASLLNPLGVAVDSVGNVYVADSTNNRIRLLTPGPVPTIKQGG